MVRIPKPALAKCQSRACRALSTSALRRALITLFAMQVRPIDDAGLPILLLEGDVDLHQSPVLRAVLLAHVETRTPALALDLSGVPYIDSSGLATIVEYVRSAQEFGGKIVLLGLSVRVKTIFDLVRLGEILPIVETRDAARARLLSPPA